MIEPVDGETSLRPDLFRVAVDRRNDADAPALRWLARGYTRWLAGAGVPVAVEPGPRPPTGDIAQHSVVCRRSVGDGRLSRRRQGTASERRGSLQHRFARGQ